MGANLPIRLIVQHNLQLLQAIPQLQGLHGACLHVYKLKHMSEFKLVLIITYYLLNFWAMISYKVK